jgi:hypothetical protein
MSICGILLQCLVLKKTSWRVCLVQNKYHHYLIIFTLTEAVFNRNVDKLPQVGVNPITIRLPAYYVKLQHDN